MPPRADPATLPADIHHLLEPVGRLIEFGGRLADAWSAAASSPPRSGVTRLLRRLGLTALMRDAGRSIGSGVFDVATTDRAWFDAVVARDPSAPAPSQASRWPLHVADLEAARRLAFEWADARLPYMQNVIEALPHELSAPRNADNEGTADDDAGLRAAMRIVARRYIPPNVVDEDTIAAQAPVLAARVFHGLVKEMYARLDCTYVAVALYEDTKQSIAGRLNGDTSGLHAFPQSALLLDRHIVTGPGVVVRIRRGAYLRHERQERDGRHQPGVMEVVAPSASGS